MSNEAPVALNDNNRELREGFIHVASVKDRLSCLDHFRGYAFFTMLMVNYLGGYDTMPETFRHHGTGFSFADHVAPLFLFAAGIGFRISFSRRKEGADLWKARRSAVRRSILLILLGIFIYSDIEFTRENFMTIVTCDMWDALVDIGFAGLLTLPFIDRGIKTRLGMAVCYAVGYQCLYIFTGYSEWVMENSIDGGPLGPLAWAFQMLIGTIVWDYINRPDKARFIAGMYLAGFAMFGAGQLMNQYWLHSQKGMTISYTVGSTGVSMLVFLAFYLLNDVLRITVPHMSVLGRNPLLLYAIHSTIYSAVGYRLFPDDSPAYKGWIGFAVVYLICYAIARFLDWRKWYLRL
ncbi:MAG TPA: heparan-alpha-glucosaminide N-acetyltransferase domain-containing protein [Candidatus Brocadiia bacterium]|nr:heparan-alpha-glucosaminide N-acetyltransferase domain-containing protein [Candidatus Brocadiia bacterium]